MSSPAPPPTLPLPGVKGTFHEGRRRLRISSPNCTRERESLGVKTGTVAFIPLLSLSVCVILFFFFFSFFSCTKLQHSAARGESRRVASRRPVWLSLSGKWKQLPLQQLLLLLRLHFFFFFFFFFKHSGNFWAKWVLEVAADSIQILQIAQQKKKKKPKHSSFHSVPFFLFIIIIIIVFIFFFFFFSEWTSWLCVFRPQPENSFPHILLQHTVFFSLFVCVFPPHGSDVAVRPPARTLEVWVLLQSFTTEQNHFGLFHSFFWCVATSPALWHGAATSNFLFPVVRLCLLLPLDWQVSVFCIF